MLRLCVTIFVGFDTYIDIMKMADADAGGVIDPLEAERLWVVIATIAINVVAVGLLVLAPWSNWRSAVGLNAIDNGMLVGFMVMRTDRLMARLLIFGLVVGLVELAATSLAGGLYPYAGLFTRRRVDDVAFASVDATCVGGCGGAVRLFGATAARAVWRSGIGCDWAAWCGEYFVLRGDGATDSLVAVQRLPNDLGDAVLHHRGEVDDRCGVCAVG